MRIYMKKYGDTKLLAWDISSIHCQGIVPFNVIIVQFELVAKTPVFAGVF